MKEQFNYAISSPDAFLQFLCDYQYDVLIERAIGLQIVNSNVGSENLYNALLATQTASPNTFAQAINFNLKELPSNSAEENALVSLVKEYISVSQPKMRRSLPGFCSPTFQGPLTPEQQAAIDNGACDGGGSGWTSENTNTAIEAAGDILNFFGNLFGGGFGSGSGTGTGSGSGSGSGTGTGNGSGNGNQGGGTTDYLPWVFGGIAVLIVIIVIVLLYLKSKK